MKTVNREPDHLKPREVFFGTEGEHNRREHTPGTHYVVASGGVEEGEHTECPACTYFDTIPASTTVEQWEKWLSDEGAVKRHYLDASAMVLLFVDEVGCDAVRRFFNTETNFCSTPLCLAEALGVLKRKKLTQDRYFKAAQQLVLDAWSGGIKIDDLGLFDPAVFAEVEAMARARELDVSDALQIETIRKGYFSGLGGPSASVLITGDRGLARAARCEGIRAWYCRTDPRPPWLPEGP